MRKTAAEYLTYFKRRVFSTALDAHGKRFPAYSQSYKDILKRDFRKKGRGKAKTGKGQRYEGFEGLALQTGAQKIGRRRPDLTGLTRRLIKVVKAETDSFVIGWTGHEAEKAQWLEEMGRDFITDIPAKDYKYILKSLGVSIDKQWAKVKDITVKVGY